MKRILPAIVLLLVIVLTAIVVSAVSYASQTNPSSADPSASKRTDSVPQSPITQEEFHALYDIVYHDEFTADQMTNDELAVDTPTLLLRLFHNAAFQEWYYVDDTIQHYYPLLRTSLNGISELEARPDAVETLLAIYWMNQSDYKTSHVANSCLFLLAQPPFWAQLDEEALQPLAEALGRLIWLDDFTREHPIWSTPYAAAAEPTFAPHPNFTPLTDDQLASDTKTLILLLTDRRYTWAEQSWASSDGPQTFYRRLKETFRGFSELETRPDAAETLLKLCQEADALVDCDATLFLLSRPPFRTQLTEDEWQSIVSEYPLLDDWIPDTKASG